MAVKPENRARSALNKLIPLSIHREKMGSPYSAGTADQWYSGFPFDMWVEFKFLPKPPTRPFELQLSTLQSLWLLNRYNENRAVGVILLFPAKYGCWMFFNREWEGKIDPAKCTTYSRQEVADFITRGCTEYAHYSALIRHSEGAERSLSDSDIYCGNLLHDEERER
jgi:hypothetical protein